MKYRGPMLVVKDIEKTKEFYTEVLQLRIISDMGENITFTGGFSFQTEHSWIQFTGSPVDFFRYQGNVLELYFEEEDFDSFLARLKQFDVEWIGKEMVMPWGQRVVRFYDPDKHIIEVGEEIKAIVKRFHKEGLTIDEIVEKTYLKKGIVERMLKN